MTHAYLIMAHRSDEVLEKLLEELDYPGNAVFLHMDAKNLVFNRATYALRHASFSVVPRMDVLWGGYSMIECEYGLLRAAIEAGPFDYYHLLSGQDLALKTQGEIHAFFDEHAGEEFVGFQQAEFAYPDRVLYSHRIWNRYGRGKNSRLVSRLDRLSVELQRLIGRRRNEGIAFQKGANWFSITHALAEHVLAREGWVRGVFADTLCPDELFLQTVMLGTPFMERLHVSPFDPADVDPHENSATMRYVDWEKGSPWTLRVEDEKALFESDMLFARKFDAATDLQVARDVHARVMHAQRLEL